MIVFERYGKTVRISDRHWKSLRSRFNPEKAEYYPNGQQYFIHKNCLLCNEHPSCERCGFFPFQKVVDEGGDSLVGCKVFLRRLFKNNVAFRAEDLPFIKWHRTQDTLARKQLRQIQKLMDEIEAQQK